MNATPVFLSRVVSGGVAMTSKDFLKHGTKLLFFFFWGVWRLYAASTVLCMRITTHAEKEKKIGDMNVHVPQTTSS